MQTSPRRAVSPAVPRVVYFRAMAKVEVAGAVAAVAGLAHAVVMAGPVTVAVGVQVIVGEEIMGDGGVGGDK